MKKIRRTNHSYPTRAVFATELLLVGSVLRLVDVDPVDCWCSVSELVDRLESRHLTGYGVRHYKSD